MAQLSKTSCKGDWDIGPAGWADRHESQMKALQEASNKVAEALKSDSSASLVGALVFFPWADGHATYRVCKNIPLTLEHVPYSDAWQVPYHQIRGLRRQDVVRQLR